MLSFVETLKENLMMRNIGFKIRQIRKQKAWTQEDLAELAQVNLRTIQRIENSENEPSGKTLQLICSALEVNIEEVMDFGKETDTSFLLFFHLSVLSFILIPLGNVILPLILWINNKNKIKELNKLGVNILNFQIIWSILVFISIIGFAYSKIMHYAYTNHFLGIWLGLVVLNILLPIYYAFSTKKQQKPAFYPNLIKLLE
ncbi:MAG: DUF4870 domain-containing protein [Bacteroidota bacterium]